ncbi:MAG: hypothetical protein Q9M10_01655, partial [Mariprofundaceae bacterium]|nr:hypothetical protein [Mariprofundaceae bacterium]
SFKHETIMIVETFEQAMSLKYKLSDTIYQALNDNSLQLLGGKIISIFSTKKRGAQAPLFSLLKYNPNHLFFSFP